MKRQLLELLRVAPGKFVSGEEISQHLGISRVSVWKHIKKLQECDYQIESGPTGYRLINEPDSLQPWEFSEYEQLVHYYREVDSTMIEAKQLARKGCPPFTVVIAERQIKGKGRLQRVWHSADGGLYFTVILKPEIPAIMMSRYSFAASLCLVTVIRNLFDIDAQVKWPNDILIGQKKLCGMLAEMEMEADLVSFLNIGIGLNVNNDPTVDEPNAVSIAQLLGHPVSRKEILAAFLVMLRQELSQPDLGQIIPRWKQQAMTLNRYVKIVTTTEEWEGLAIDVDETGALILKLADGSLKKVFYGDCFHLA